MTRNPDLRQALRSADWDALLPNLLAYAARRIRRVGWGSGHDIEPSKLSVEQVVNTAVEHCLDGTRAWDPDAVDLAGMLRGVIRSLTSSERKKYARAKTLTNSEVAEAAIGNSPSSEDEALEEERRQALLDVLCKCTTGDSDLEALYAAILDGHLKREEIAAALGWKVERVTAARIKLQRRLVRLAPEKFGRERKTQAKRTK